MQKPIIGGAVGLYAESRNDILYSFKQIVADDMVEYAIKWISADDLGNNKTFLIPSEHYFVMGDNRDVARDSRGTLGFVPQANLVGRVEFLPHTLSRWLSKQWALSSP